MKLAHLSLVFLVILSACASSPRFDTKPVDLTITPRRAVTELPAIGGRSVLWGGVILGTHNLETHTQIEVLAYPLNSNQIPQRDRDPLGRFILERRGFLEPASYAEGRLITVLGKLMRNESSKVGDSNYFYPVIEASDLHLWSRDSEYNNRSNVRFGIGIGIGL